MTIGSPTRERTRRRSSIQKSGIATASAEANTSYRYRPSNRSASWMRNHEASSPFVSTIPNSTPARKYAGSRRSRARATEVAGTVIVTVSPGKKQRQQEVARHRPGREERDHGDQGRELEIGQPCDPVTRGTAAGVRRAEPDDEPAARDEQQTLEGEQRAPVEQLAGDQPRKIVNAEAGPPPAVPLGRAAHPQGSVAHRGRRVRHRVRHGVRRRLYLGSRDHRAGRSPVPVLDRRGRVLRGRGGGEPLPAAAASFQVTR